MLKTENVRKKISDVSPWIPCASRVSSVVPASATLLFASSVALGGVVRAGVVDPALDSVDRVGDSCFDLRRLFGDTAEDEQEDDHSERDEPRSTRMAPAIRGIRAACILVTTGPATVARMAPTITGSAIVDVSPSSQMAPKRTRPTPTKNQASSPRSRSHMGAEKTRDSEVASILTTVSSDAGSRFCGCSDSRDGSDRRALPSSPRALCRQRRTRPESMPTRLARAQSSEAVPSRG